MLAQVQLPLDDAEAAVRPYDNNHADIGGSGAASGKLPNSSCAPSRRPELANAAILPKEEV